MRQALVGLLWKSERVSKLNVFKWTIFSFYWKELSIHTFSGRSTWGILPGGNSCAAARISCARPRHGWRGRRRSGQRGLRGRVTPLGGPGYGPRLHQQGQSHTRPSRESLVSFVTCCYKSQIKKISVLLGRDFFLPNFPNFDKWLWRTNFVLKVPKSIIPKARIRSWQKSIGFATQCFSF